MWQQALAESYFSNILLFIVGIDYVYLSIFHVINYLTFGYYKLVATNIGTLYLGRVCCHFSLCIPVSGVIGSYANFTFNHLRK